MVDPKSDLRIIDQRPGPAHHRDGVLDRIRLAQAVARQGDTAEAGTLGMLMLPDALAMKSGSVRRDFRRVRNYLSRQSDLTKPACDFIANYDDTALCA